jgi:hypothetical protein
VEIGRERGKGVTKLIWLLAWMFDDGKNTLSEDVAAWRASVYRWIKIVLFSVGGAGLLYYLGHQAAWRASQPFEGLATIVWVGDGSTSRSVGTGHKGGANGEIRVWLDGARVLVDGFSDPLTYQANPNTLTSWLHAGDRVRVTFKRGTFLFWESMYITNVMQLNVPPQ